MDLAKPGEIKSHCEPNALSTFQEYLDDYASQETQAEGRKLTARRIAEMEPAPRRIATNLIHRVWTGERDVFV
jgi:2-iminoacetate synthase